MIDPLVPQDDAGDALIDRLFRLEYIDDQKVDGETLNEPFWRAATEDWRIGRTGHNYTLWCL